MQAKDISDVELLTWLRDTQRFKGLWVNMWDFVGSQWDEDYIPHNVLWAKLRKLIKRGLLDGCTCGCRGDFELTAKGEEFIQMYNYNKDQSIHDWPGNLITYASRDAEFTLKLYEALHPRLTIFQRFVNLVKKAWQSILRVFRYIYRIKL